MKELFLVISFILSGCTSLIKKDIQMSDVIRGIGRPGYGTVFRMELNTVKYLVTAGHVCDGNKHMLVQGHKVEVLKSVEQYPDACILKDNPKISLKTLKHSYHADIGSEVVMHGIRVNNQTDLPYRTTTKGYIQGIFEGEVYEVPSLCEVECISLRYMPPAFLSDLLAGPGNSGSPVLNSQGHVIGILVAGNSQYRMINPIIYAVRIIENKYNPSIEELKENMAVDQMSVDFCNSFGKKPQVAKLGFYSFNVFCIEHGK